MEGSERKSILGAATVRERGTSDAQSAGGVTESSVMRQDDEDDDDDEIQSDREGNPTALNDTAQPQWTTASRRSCKTTPGKAAFRSLLEIKNNDDDGGIPPQPQPLPRPPMAVESRGGPPKFPNDLFPQNCVVFHNFFPIFPTKVSHDLIMTFLEFFLDIYT